MDLHGHSLIAGQRATGGPIFRAVNPATTIRLEPDFHEATPVAVDQAMVAAGKAFPAYAACSPKKRSALLKAIATAIEALGEPLLRRAQEETGLPLTRLAGERARTCTQLRLFAQVVREGSWVDARIDPALPDRQPLPRSDLRRMLRPLGPVVVFGASNFPLAFSVAGGDTASALAAGCPVVVKAHPAHPGTSEMVGSAIIQALQECDLPPGIFSLVHGGAAVGVGLVKHAATAAAGFTGSHRAGRALFDAAAARARPIPVFAEMSSLNPVFLLPGALRDRAGELVRGLTASFTLGVGQFCTKPGIVLAVQGPELDSFVQLLTPSVQSTRCATMLTPDIGATFAHAIARIAALPGIKLLASAPGSPDERRSEGQPSVALTSGEYFLAHPELAVEVFGPFTLVVAVRSLEEMIACAQQFDGQLTATVHGQPADLASTGPLLAELEQKAGRLIINGFPTGVEVCPAMNHGGPYPATTDTRFTSVGTAALLRFARPVCFQDFPDELLPPELQNTNPCQIMRLVNGALTRNPL